jgi:hypothetical protein
VNGFLGTKKDIFRLVRWFSEERRRNYNEKSVVVKEKVFWEISKHLTGAGDGAFVPTWALASWELPLPKQQ